MGPLTPELSELLGDATARTVFETVAVERRARFKELLEAIGAGVDDGGGDRERLRDLLDRLRRHGLIEEHEAPIEDFRTYYVTADGLSVQRALRRLAPG